MMQKVGPIFPHFYTSITYVDNPLCCFDVDVIWIKFRPDVLKYLLYFSPYYFGGFPLFFICLIDLKLVIIYITMKFCMLQASHRTAYLNSWTNFAPKQKQTKGEDIERGGQVRS